ncbi:TetR/AcrR family transcriptional regulator [Kitasatospora sp. NPDC008050]|uniref:TetR/AcrR family transcriptional regulator n=1 Tax=Kitasatospora sp. NPDC008050 TaxID=3364021 RepID=UPI0036E3D396
MTDTTTGRRERKKAATRQALADAALRLFLERGYDQVSVREIADAADVSTTTLFAHFPGKEALVFDQDSEIEDALVSAVRDRAPGQSIPAALRERMLEFDSPTEADPDQAAFLHLVRSTPALEEYSRRMWLRHERALTHAIAEAIDAPEDDLLSAALARFALQSRDLASGHGGRRASIERAFELLEHGWHATHGED